MTTTLVAFSALSAVAVLTAPQNLITNGSFEEVRDGQPAGWTARDQAPGSGVCDQACEGVRALRIVGANPDKIPLYLQSNLPAKPGGTYLVQARAKTAKAGTNFRCYVEWWLQEGKYGGAAQTKWRRGTGKWQLVSYSFQLPQNAKPPYIVLQLKGEGEIVWDDVAMLALQVLPPPPADQRPALLLNGHCQDDADANGIPDYWSPTNIRACRWQDGTLLLESADSDVISAWRQAGIPTQPGRRYRLTYRARGDEGARFRCHLSWARLRDERGDHGGIAQQEGSVWLKADGAWVDHRLEFTSPYKPTAGMTLSLELQGAGKAAADDLALAELGPGSLTLGPSPPRASALDTSRRGVHLRKDGIALIDGTPFFPLGLYHFENNDHEFALLNQAGFNLLGCHLDPEKAQDLLDRLQRFGLKAFGHSSIVVAPPADNAAVREKWQTLVRDTLAVVGRHPAFVAWYSRDEPAWGGQPLERLKEAYDAITQADPDHLIWVLHAPRNTIETLQTYNQAGDVTGADIYPVPEGGGHSELENKTITSAGEYTDRMVATGRPVWMVPQGFAWAHLGDKPNPISPTYVQSRFMAYQMIIHGARGLVWWGTRYGRKDPQLWADLQKLAGELAELSAALVGEDGPRRTHVGLGELSPQPVEYLVKRAGGEVYLLAANASPEPATLHWNAREAGVQAAALHVLFENRTVPLTDGQLDDDFTPYAVHVYSTAPKPPERLVPVTKATRQELGR